MLDGVRTNVSIGYAIDPSGDRQAGEKEGRPIVVRESWKPLEVSLVSIPADPSVGTNRSGGMEMAKKQVQGQGSERQQMIMEHLAAGVSREEAEREVDSYISRSNSPINDNKDTLTDWLSGPPANAQPASQPAGGGCCCWGRPQGVQTERLGLYHGKAKATRQLQPCPWGEFFCSWWQTVFHLQAAQSYDGPCQPQSPEGCCP